MIKLLIKLAATIYICNWTIVESGFTHHKPTNHIELKINVISHWRNDIIKENHPTPNAVWYATTGWKKRDIWFIHLKWLLLQESYICFTLRAIINREYITVWCVSGSACSKPDILSFEYSRYLSTKNLVKTHFSSKFYFEYLKYGVL